MNILIIYAHPEDKSFNSAMKQTALSTLRESGHEVKISDLYKMKFKASLDSADFVNRADDKYLNILAEQKNSLITGEIREDIRAEQEKIKWADFLLFQYPLWWFSVPAILKGWFDRVLMTGFAWDFESIYEKGLLLGKKGMLSVTTGGPIEIYAKEGLHGWNMEQLLHPVNHGVLYFCGIKPLEPFVSYAVFQATDEDRKEYLRKYRNLLENIENINELKY